MVDPLTTNKFLAQPIPGSDVGTWATPMNNNAGIIDASFGGVATVALTNAPVTLSAAQYQNVFIVFTGALSGNCAITLPAIGSYYTFQNLTSNSSTFQVTLLTTVAGSQQIGCPPGEPTEVFTDGSNVKFRALGRIGSYWDYAGSSVPWWVSACTVPPYLNCDGTAFSSATYPVLTSILGSTTLPDAKGRLRLTLDQGVGRVSSGVSGVAGNTIFSGGGDQSLQSHTHANTLNDPGHTHALSALNNGVITSSAAGGTTQAGGGQLTVTLTVLSATTGITITNAANGAGGSQNMPPVYVGGLTLIRAA